MADHAPHVNRRSYPVVDVLASEAGQNEAVLLNAQVPLA